MDASERNPAVKPNPAECPKQFCYFWIKKGARFPDGVYESLGKALKDASYVQDDLCGCTFGVCKRLNSIQGYRDWYEPNGPELERAGLPWFYFIPTPEKVDDESREEYIQESEALWGSEHWKE